MTASAQPNRDNLPPPSVEEVAEGVYAYVQPDGSWWINNTGFLAGSRAATVIDLCSTEARTRAFLDAVAEVANGPVQTVVNTHAHGDHTHGNCLTLPGATIVGHQRARESIQQMGVGGPLLDAIWPGVEWGTLEAAPPVLTFTDRVTLWVDDTEVQLIHLGPAHTDNDVIAWLPATRVLFAGDLVFNGGHPNNVGGSIPGTIAALDALEALAPSVIVPGHGGICDVAVLDEQRGYCRWIESVAADAVRSSVTPLEAARSTDLGDYAGWLDTERVAGNLHRAMGEITGDEVNVAAAFGDMVELNGGPLRCLA
ncbi:MAG: MBL fold metallo-hydrolase [Acidimicrobiales bacterium]